MAVPKKIQMLSPNRPLWLPTGSIRAVIALMVIAVTLLMFGLNREVPETMAVLATAVIVYYFQKDKSGA